MGRKKRQPAGLVWSMDDLLHSRPVANVSMILDRIEDGSGAVAAVPMRRPSWLVPPLSWIVPFSSHRRVQLDRVGLSVLDLCDGQRTVENIIEQFAASHRLSYREAQLPVTQFMQIMLQRGLVAAVSERRSS